MYLRSAMIFKTILIAGVLCGSCYATDKANAKAQSEEVAEKSMMSVYILKAQSFG